VTTRMEPRSLPARRPALNNRLNIALRFRATRVINRHARTNRAERKITRMTSTEAPNSPQAAAIAEQDARVAPKKTASKVTRPKEGALKAKKSTKQVRLAAAGKTAKPATKKDAKRGVPREGSKSAMILGMLAKGATLAELMSAAKWQRHSVRGFLSHAAKTRPLRIKSTRTKDGERFYKLAK